MYRFQVIASHLSKVTNFKPFYLRLKSPQEVTPFEFRREIWCQKTRVTGLSCSIICVILCLAVLVQCRSVSDTHTHTHRHTMTANTALSIASRGKNGRTDQGIVWDEILVGPRNHASIAGAHLRHLATTIERYSIFVRRRCVLLLYHHCIATCYVPAHCRGH